MRKNTHQIVYYYAYIKGFEVFTAKPKRKTEGTFAQTVPEIEACRKIIRAQHKREQAVIDRLFAAAKENENRPYEEHKKLVERQVERIQEMHRLRIMPCPWPFGGNDPCPIKY